MLESWKGSLMSSAPKWYIIWQVRYVDLTSKLMKSLMNKREFLTASVGAGLGLGGGRAAFAQQGSVATLRTAGDRRVPSRMAKTTKLFKSPPGFPNGIAVAPEEIGRASCREKGENAVVDE